MRTLFVSLLISTAALADEAPVTPAPAPGFDLLNGRFEFGSYGRVGIGSDLARGFLAGRERGGQSERGAERQQCSGAASAQVTTSGSRVISPERSVRSTPSMRSTTSTRSGMLRVRNASPLPILVQSGASSL